MIGISDQEHEKIVSLLENIKERINSFYNLTCKQSEILKTGDIDELGNNIDARQSVIDEIDILKQELDILLKPYENQSPEISSGNPYIKRIALLQEQIKQKLLDTKLVDEKNDEMAKGLTEKYKSEGKRLKMSRKSIKLYNQDVLMQDSVFYDKRK